MKKYFSFVLAAVTLFHVSRVSNSASIRASDDFVREAFGKESKVMGADVVVHLFNLRIYRERILPAYRLFLRKDEAEPLITLLRECAKKLEANPRLSDQLLWSKESAEEDIGILTGTVYYSPDRGKTSNQGERKKTHKVRRDYARGLLSSEILEVLCVPHDRRVNPEQDMSNSRLRAYLYEKSEWIEELFTSRRAVRGDHLELSIGECTDLFTKEDAQEFDRELTKIAPPEDPELRREYENLREMLKLALEDPDLTLALSVT
ncbi:MAG: hypothetical protein ACRD9S_08825 [Pyrinomonadaceae bacterium]